MVQSMCVFLMYSKGNSFLFDNRYPIMPVHDEGISAWKELEALEDIVMQTQTYGSLCREPLTPASAATIATSNLDKPISIRTGQSWDRNIPHHTHDILVC